MASRMLLLVMTCAWIFSSIELKDPLFFMIICIGPVSYTHLDVYKRQSLFLFISNLVLARLLSPDDFGCIAMPVSYTHLDVYKRQFITIRPLRFVTVRYIQI